MGSKRKKMKSEFQSKRTFEERVRDSSTIKEHHPDKIAVIVERSKSERTLPILDKTKFLVPGHVTVTELIRVLRRRLQLAPGQAFFLLSNRGLPPGTQTLSELWESDHDEDGFIYVWYAAQESFVLCVKSDPRTFSFSV